MFILRKIENSKYTLWPKYRGIDYVGGTYSYHWDLKGWWGIYGMLSAVYNVCLKQGHNYVRFQVLTAASIRFTRQCIPEVNSEQGHNC
jgi:hypothetical protein